MMLLITHWWSTHLKNRTNYSLEAVFWQAQTTRGFFLLLLFLLANVTHVDSLVMQVMKCIVGKEKRAEIRKNSEKKKKKIERRKTWVFLDWQIYLQNRLSLSRSLSLYGRLLSNFDELDNHQTRKVSLFIPIFFALVLIRISSIKYWVFFFHSLPLFSVLSNNIDTVYQGSGRELEEWIQYWPSFSTQSLAYLLSRISLLKLINRHAFFLDMFIVLFIKNIIKTK